MRLRGLRPVVVTLAALDSGPGGSLHDVGLKAYDLNGTTLWFNQLDLQRGAIGGEPNVFLGIWESGHAGALVSRHRAVRSAVVLDAANRGINLALNPRRGVIRVVVVEIGLDVLRVVDVAVPALRPIDDSAEHQSKCGGAQRALQSIFGAHRPAYVNSYYSICKNLVICG